MKKVTCILLDDERESNDRLECQLNKLDHIDIQSKRTIPELAINDIISKKPDIVFLDVEMPNKTGFEVVEDVRSNQVYPTFIFVTAFNQYAINAIKKEAFDYLLKPVNLDELKQTLHRFCSESFNHKSIKLSDCTICKNLSSREQETLLMIIDGKTSKEIAKQLFISKPTVDFHRRNILSKTNSRSIEKLIHKILNIKITN